MKWVGRWCSRYKIHYVDYSLHRLNVWYSTEYHTFVYLGIIGLFETCKICMCIFLCNKRLYPIQTLIVKLTPGERRRTGEMQVNCFLLSLLFIILIHTAISGKEDRNGEQFYWFIKKSCHKIRGLWTYLIPPSCYDVAIHHTQLRCRRGYIPATTKHNLY